MSPGNPFIFGSRSQVTKTLPAWALHSYKYWLLLVVIVISAFTCAIVLPVLWSMTQITDGLT